MMYADQYCSYTEQLEPVHTYTFTGPCTETGRPHSVTVPAEELFAYRQGIHIQSALVSVSREDREFLMTGISPEGWLGLFGPGPTVGDEEDEECDSEKDSSSKTTEP